MDFETYNDVTVMRTLWAHDCCPSCGSPLGDTRWSEMETADETSWQEQRCGVCDRGIREVREVTTVFAIDEDGQVFETLAVYTIAIELGAVVEMARRFRHGTCSAADLIAVVDRIERDTTLRAGLASSREYVDAG